MKKTTKSPEDVEVTPNKKKLKQARLPFMLLSDVSPKTESPSARKRKLSAPDVEPAHKVGKLSKENNTIEELVVISDEDSKGVPSPKKQDTRPNPYVKLVDAARKKKIQKNKAQKKSKSRSSKTKIKTTSENETAKENSQSSECDEVEMMEVDDQTHEDLKEKTEKLVDGDVENKSDKSITSNEETNNNSKEKKVRKPQRVSRNTPKAQVKENLEKSPQKSLQKKATTIVSNIEGVVCIDDSNSSSDVKMSQSTKPIPDESATESMESTTKSNTPNKAIFAKKESPKTVENNGKSKLHQNVSPKRSSRNKNIKTSKKEHVNSESNSVMDVKNTDDEMDDTTQEEEPNPVCTVSSDSDANSDESPKTTISVSSTESKTKSDTPTPKRSIRIKDKDETSLNMSTTSSKLDESMTSNPSTPKQNKSLSENSQLDKSFNESIKNLTPKQLLKKQEAAKKKEEREREKQEREMKKQQEKEEREKLRKEKEEQKKLEREEKEEAKRKEKEEKEVLRKKEKEEKEKQKELERKAKEEKEEQKRKEKEDKEEQKKKEKEARDEEKRKKQEALELEKQEQELKKKKAAEAFVNFFVPKQKAEKGDIQEKIPVSQNSMLSSFRIKVDMRLAPTTRVELTNGMRDNLDKFLENPDVDQNYLKDLKSGAAKTLTSGKTWPLDDKDDDVMVVEDELPPIDVAGEVITCESAPRERLRPKLLAFHENHRPPYWGTWRKSSAHVKPRRPFGQDEKLLDYEVDSDDDWEDEGDGESLDGSAGGSDDDGGNDDYELDNEVFVPHGYLSDEEATMDEDDDDVLNLSPETQKARLKHLEDEFESELKKPTERLKPRLYGLLWESPEGGKPEKCVDALWNYFEKFAMIMDDVTPLLQPLPEPDEPEKRKVKKKKLQANGEKNEQSPKSEKKKKVKTENKEKNPKQEVKKPAPVPNQPGINNFLKKVKPTQIA